MEDAECHRCSISLTLESGSEWPKDRTLILCWSCAIGEIERLRKRVNKLKKEQSK